MFGEGLGAGNVISEPGDSRNATKKEFMIPSSSSKNPALRLRPLPRMCAPLVAISLLLASAIALANAPTREDLLRIPAASESGVRDLGLESAPYKPVFGPRVDCGPVGVQGLVLNPTIVVGEPLYLRLLIKSLTPGLQQEFRSRLVFGTDLHVYVQPPPGQRPYEYLATERGSVVPSAVMRLEKVKLYRLDFRMAFDKQTVSGAAFEVPGVYTIQVTHACEVPGAEERDMVLGVFTITVKPAEGDDAKALDFLNDHKLYECIHTGTARHTSSQRPINETQAKSFQRIVEQAPAAALRPYALLILADYWREKRDFAKALGYLDMLKNEYPGMLVADEAHFSTLRIQQERNDRAGALAAFTAIWTDPIRTQLVYQESPSWETYVKPRLHNDTIGTQWFLSDPPGPDPAIDAGSPQLPPNVTLSPEALQDLENFRQMGLR